jgi:hypothetical protein
MDRLRILSPEIHGVLDYPMAGALMAAPNLFGFNRRRGPSVTIPRILGGMALGQSAMTDYRPGLVRTLPMRAHLAMDAVMGSFLALSPFLFGFFKRPRKEWLPHTIVGASMVLGALLTRTRPNLY